MPKIMQFFLGTCAKISYLIKNIHMRDNHKKALLLLEQGFGSIVIVLF